MHEYYIKYIQNQLMTFALAQGASSLGVGNLVFILYISSVILVHILHVILMHILNVLTRIQILDVLLLLLATTVIAPLFGTFSHRATTLLAALLSLKQ